MVVVARGGRRGGGGEGTRAGSPQENKQERKKKKKMMLMMAQQQAARAPPSPSASLMNAARMITLYSSFFAQPTTVLSPTAVYPRIQHLQYTVSVVWYFGRGIYRTIVLLLYCCIQ